MNERDVDENYEINDRCVIKIFSNYYILFFNTNSMLLLICHT